MRGAWGTCLTVRHLVEMIRHTGNVFFKLELSGTIKVTNLFQNPWDEA